MVIRPVRLSQSCRPIDPPFWAYRSHRNGHGLIGLWIEWESEKKSSSLLLFRQRKHSTRSKNLILSWEEPLYPAMQCKLRFLNSWFQYNTWWGTGDAHKRIFVPKSVKKALEDGINIWAYLAENLVSPKTSAKALNSSRSDQRTVLDLLRLVNGTLYDPYIHALLTLLILYQGSETTSSLTTRIWILGTSPIALPQFFSLIARFALSSSPNFSPKLENGCFHHRLWLEDWQCTQPESFVPRRFFEHRRKITRRW